MSNYKNCPNCDNSGFNVYPDIHTGEPFQEQCQFCYEEPDSIFNVIKGLKEKNERLKAEVKDLCRALDELNEHI